MESYEIRPGVGVGSILLGFAKEQVREKLGSPANTKTIVHADESSEEIWTYGNDELTFSFDDDHDNRLSTITVRVAEATLCGDTIIGLDEKSLSDHVQKMGLGNLILEDDFEENGRDYICDNESISFWVLNGCVDSISIMPLYDSGGNTVKWPSP